MVSKARSHNRQVECRLERSRGVFATSPQRLLLTYANPSFPLSLPPLRHFNWYQILLLSARPLSIQRAPQISRQHQGSSHSISVRNIACSSLCAAATPQLTLFCQYRPSRPAPFPLAIANHRLFAHLCPHPNNSFHAFRVRSTRVNSDPFNKHYISFQRVQNSYNRANNRYAMRYSTCRGGGRRVPSTPRVSRPDRLRKILHTYRW